MEDYCQKFYSQQIMLRSLTLQLKFFKGRIKKLEKACVDLATLRASVRTVKVVTHQHH